MKKVVSILLVLVMLFGLCACSTSGNSNDSGSGSSTGDVKNDRAAYAVRRKLNIEAAYPNSKIDYIYADSVKVTYLREDWEDNEYTAKGTYRYRNKYGSDANGSFDAQLTYNPSSGEFTVNDFSY